MLEMYDDWRVMTWIHLRYASFLPKSIYMLWTRSSAARRNVWGPCDWKGLSKLNHFQWQCHYSRRQDCRDSRLYLCNNHSSMEKRHPVVFPSPWDSNKLCESSFKLAPVGIQNVTVFPIASIKRNNSLRQFFARKGIVLCNARVVKHETALKGFRFSTHILEQIDEDATKLSLLNQRKGIYKWRLGNPFLKWFCQLNWIDL